jgi:hypothetical protein
MIFDVPFDLVLGVTDNSMGFFLGLGVSICGVVLFFLSGLFFALYSSRLIFFLFFVFSSSIPFFSTFWKIVSCSFIGISTVFGVCRLAFLLVRLSSIFVLHSQGPQGLVALLVLLLFPHLCRLLALTRLGPFLVLWQGDSILFLCFCLRSSHDLVDGLVYFLGGF